MLSSEGWKGVDGTGGGLTGLAWRADLVKRAHLTTHGIRQDVFVGALWVDPTLMTFIAAPFKFHLTDRWHGPGRSPHSVSPSLQLTFVFPSP